jgi:hypothetical protein
MSSYRNIHRKFSVWRVNTCTFPYSFATSLSPPFSSFFSSSFYYNFAKRWSAPAYIIFSSYFLFLAQSMHFLCLYYHQSLGSFLLYPPISICLVSCPLITFLFHNLKNVYVFYQCDPSFSFVTHHYKLLAWWVPCVFSSAHGKISKPLSHLLCFILSDSPLVPIWFLSHVTGSEFLESSH